MTQSRNISSTYKGIYILNYFTLRHCILDTYTKLAKPFDDISIPPLCDISIEAVNKSLNSDNKFIDD